MTESDLLLITSLTAVGVLIGCVVRWRSPLRGNLPMSKAWCLRRRKPGQSVSGGFGSVGSVTRWGKGSRVRGDCC